MDRSQSQSPKPSPIVGQYWTEDDLADPDFRATYMYEQTKRWRVKSSQTQQPEFYRAVAKMFEDVDACGPLACMGTRHNRERDLMSQYTGFEAESVDIVEGSKADIICDFNELPDELRGRWSSVYSNALDHSPDPLECIMHWLDFMRSDGTLIIGLSLHDCDITPSDCSKFDVDAMARWLGDHVRLLLTRDFHGWRHFAMRRKT